MTTYLARRRQAIALRLQLKLTCYTAAKTAGYLTIDGEPVPYELGLAALNSGQAFLMGDLLVGLILSADDY
jgi:hypothetical protein